MKKQNKLLQLNKETLVALKDKQMDAIRGGQEAVSFTNCGPTEYCTFPTQPAPPASCCKKTCRGEEPPVQS